MKKSNICRTICAFVVFLIISITTFAQQKVSTIAEIKALADGTAIEFEGEAITTYHQGELSGIAYGFNGILMQDPTGVILLKNSAFKANGTLFTDSTRQGYCAHLSGTKIQKIIGTFKKATADLPDRLEFTNSDLRKIETGTYGNEIPVQEVALSDFIKEPQKYELLSIVIKTDKIHQDGSLCYFVHGDNKIQMKPYFNVVNNTFPVGGAFYGFCEIYKGVYRFAVEGRKNILPSKVNTIVDLYNFVDDSNRSIVSSCEVEILNPVIVNYVEQDESKVNYYVQSSYLTQTSGFVFSLDKNSNSQFAIGDSLVGLKGHYSKYIFSDEKHTPTTFSISEDNISNVIVRNSNNVNVFKETKISTILGSPSEYEAQLVSLPRGILRQYDEQYYFLTYNSLRQQYDSISIVMGDDTDLSTYLEDEFIIGGIFKVVSNQPMIVIRTEKDIITENLVFESIGDMISAGRPISSSIICEISNPVLVTYKYANDEKGMYGLYLQDATGAILYKTHQSVDTINPGDLIEGIKGTFSYNVQGYEAHYLKEDTTASLSVSTHNNEVIATSVTLEQIVNAPMQYASRVVEIKDLETITKFGISQGSPYETEFIYQNGAMMNVLWDNLYDNMSVVGVVEYGIMGYGLTIFPIEIENTTKEFDGTCRRISDIRNLEDGTEFTYVGDATTTFIDFENGILIQDYTGGILLRNVQLADTTLSEIKSGMLITNIKGIYHSAVGDMLSCIEISDDDVVNIVVKDENVEVKYSSTDANALNIFYEKYYEGVALSFYKPQIIEEDESLMILFAYSANGEDFEIKMPIVIKGDIDIVNSELFGYARKFDGVLTFVVVSANKLASDPDPNPDPDPQPDNVENIHTNKNVYFTADAQLIAPEALEIYVYDVKGKLLIIEANSTINLSSLNRGIYLVRSIYIDGSVQMTKIIR